MRQERRSEKFDLRFCLMFAPGFRNALKSRSLAHIQRLATQLDDARNLDPSTRSSSLHEAAKSGRADVFSWLLLEQQHEHAEISQDARGETVLHVAAEHGETEILELYLEFYPSVKSTATALRLSQETDAMYTDSSSTG